MESPITVEVFEVVEEAKDTRTCKMKVIQEATIKPGVLWGEEEATIRKPSSTPMLNQTNSKGRLQTRLVDTMKKTESLLDIAYSPEYQT